jgi:protein-S-isoprenylcysteine O-methyltransferase Ste14
MQQLEENQPVKPARSVPWSAFSLVVIMLVGVGSYALVYFAPSPYKQWGGTIFLPFIGSIIVFRTLEECVNREIAKAFLPYAASMLLVAAALGLFASGLLSNAGWSVFAVIVCVAGICWLVRIFINAGKDFKKDVLHK